MLTPSPFITFLGTNYVPSEDDVPIIKQIIAERQSELDTLSVNIQGRERRAACIRDMEEHQALLSPARRTPFEILEAIFHACLPDFSSTAASDDITSPSHPSITVSRVSRSWRATALRSPEMWAELLIIIPDKRGYGAYVAGQLKKTERLRRALNVWTTRSGNSPLSIRLVGNSSICGGWTGHTVAISLIEAITQTSPRWREILLSVVAGHLTRDASIAQWGLLGLLRLSPTSLPQLERVDLKVVGRPWVAEALPDGHLHTALQSVLASPSLLSTPSVRCMKVHGVWIDASVSKRWPPLTTLDLDCYNPIGSGNTPAESAIHLMRQLASIPTLVEVSFVIQRRGRGGDHFPPVSTPFYAPKLKRLTLKGAPLPKGFAESLHLPVLEDLKIQCIYQSYPEGTGSGTVEFILHLGSQLKSLTFPSDLVNRKALVNILDALPNVDLSVSPNGFGTHLRSRFDTGRLLRDEEAIEAFRSPQLRWR